MLIISASRRTDIPAFYSQWFMNRVREQFVLVSNPYNPRQIRKIMLDEEAVDAIVFWTKTPAERLPMLHRLHNYTYYFQFTLTAYNTSVEVQLPNKKTLIQTFIDLSNEIGKDRVIWRYDPILLTETFTKAYHYNQLLELVQQDPTKHETPAVSAHPRTGYR